MNTSLKEIYRAAIIGVLASHDKVERVVLFGSRAAQSQWPASDVDLALFGDQLDLTDLAHISAAMEQLTVPQRVDLLLFNTIENRTLRDHIINYGVEWYKRKSV